MLLHPARVGGRGAGATTVRVSLAETGLAGETGIFLDATAGSGIVALDDAGTWAGATALGVPFP